MVSKILLFIFLVWGGVGEGWGEGVDWSFLWILLRSDLFQY